MNCHPGCAACCIAISISTPIPGMGPKPAGVRCIHLSNDNLCLIYDSPERPAVCREFMPAPDACGQSGADALRLLTELEQATAQQVSHRPEPRQPASTSRLEPPGT